MDVVPEPQDIQDGVSDLSLDGNTDDLQNKTPNETVEEVSSSVSVSSSAEDAQPVTKNTSALPPAVFFIKGRPKATEVTFVRKALADLGMRESRNPNHWTFMWALRLQPEEFASLRGFQKVNFFPGMREFCRKDLLNRNIKAFQKRWPEEFNFWPESYNLEDKDEFAAFRALFHDPSLSSPVPEDSTESISDPVFIIKKPFASCGRGVKLLSSLAELDHLDDPSSFCHPIDTTKPLAQRYISDVMLLDGYKFTMRVYVALTSIDPLRVYTFSNGLLRICSKRYSMDPESFSDVFTHIDSIDINIHNAGAFSMSDSIPHEGLRCDFKLFFKWLEETQGADSAKIWREIKEVVAKSLLPSERFFTGAISKIVKQRSHAFEVFGYDILLDQQYKPWLLEINHTPSLAPGTNLENNVKHTMLRDLFTLVDVRAQHKPVLGQQCALVWDSILQMREAGVTAIGDFEISNLTKQDVWTIIDSQMENERCGGYERVIPWPEDPARFLPCVLPNRNLILSLWLRSGLTLDDLFPPSFEDEDEDEEEGKETEEPLETNLTETPEQ